MRSHPAPVPARMSSADDGGYTLIELMISMALTLVIVLAAFTLLEFTTRNVARTTERVHVTQAGRIVMERLMLELHSSCVSPGVAPIRSGSSSTVLRYISASGTTANSTNVELHEVIFTAPAGKATGSLTEKSWPGTGTGPAYTFNEAATPTKQLLLTGVKQSQTEEATPTAIPVFRYYRYYATGDASPVYGALNPTELTPLSTTLSSEESTRVVKVAVNITVTPEGTETKGVINDRALPFEDTALLRLTPASESSSLRNLPCS
jgi:Tfp pilus assembly protein PilV